MVDIYEKAKGVAEVGIDLATKGVGVAGGLILGKLVADTVENMVVTAPLTAVTPLQDKAIAWLANNVPVGVGAVLLSQLKTGQDMVDNVIRGGTYGLAGHIVVDTYARATHNGVPTLVLGKENQDRIQSLMRENSELKVALQKLTTNAPFMRVEEIAQPKRPLEQNYQFAEQVPGVVYEKRPLEKQYQFVGRSVTSPEVLSKGFGFNVD